MLGFAPPARLPGRLVEREEAFQQVHIRILAVGRADRDLAFERPQRGVES